MPCKSFRIDVECNVLPILGFIRHTQEGRNTQLSTLHKQYTHAHAHLQEVVIASLSLSHTTKRRFQSNGFPCTVGSSYIYEYAHTCILCIREKADKILDRSSCKAQSYKQIVNFPQLMQSKFNMSDSHIQRFKFVRTYKVVVTTLQVLASSTYICVCTHYTWCTHIHLCVCTLYMVHIHTYVTILQYSSTLLKGVERGIPSIYLIASFVCG